MAKLEFWKACERARNQCEMLMRPLRGLFEAVGWPIQYKIPYQYPRNLERKTGSLSLLLNNLDAFVLREVLHNARYLTGHETSDPSSRTPNMRLSNLQAQRAIKEADSHNDTAAYRQDTG